MAVIGASTDPRKFGGFPIHYCSTQGYKGRLFPVNPNVELVQGIPSYPSVCDIPFSVDCAVISVPADRAEAAVKECTSAGVKFGVMFSAGYAEAGRQGKIFQDRLLNIARLGGMRLLGPNCMGVFNRVANFYGTFTSAFEHFNGEGFPRAGRTSIVSQSGAIGIHLMVLLRDRGVGTGKWVTTGNQADINIADCLFWLADDPETDVIVVYLEGVPDAAAFIAALKKADLEGKPVLILKAGTTNRGARAAQSHTASLAGTDAVFDGALRQFGAIRANSMEDLATLAAVFDAGIRPKSENLGVVTISGGAGALMADAADNSGLKMPDLTIRQQQKLLNIVPFCSPINPMDTAGPGMIDMEIPLRFIDIALESKKYDSLALFLTHIGLLDRHWEKLSTGLIDRASLNPETLIVLSATATRERQLSMAQAGIPILVEPIAGIRAIGEVVKFVRRQRNRHR